MATDYQMLFNEEKLKGTEQLSYTIQGISGCSMKIENESPYVVQVFSEGIQKEMIQPYAYVTLKNDRPYTVEVKRNMKTESQQDYMYIGVKYIEGQTDYTTGSTTFNGQQRVNIQNVAQMELVGQNEVIIANTPKVELQGDTNVNIMNVPKVELFDNTVSITGTPTVAITGETNVNIANTPKVEVNNVVRTETNITNATVPITAPNGIDVNIQNGVLQVEGEVAIKSGTINANIENAQIGAEIVNSAIATNPVVDLYEDLPKNFDRKILENNSQWVDLEFSRGVYDTFVIIMDTVGYNMTPTEGYYTKRGKFLRDMRTAFSLYGIPVTTANLLGTWDNYWMEYNENYVQEIEIDDWYVETTTTNRHLIKIDVGDPIVTDKISLSYFDFQTPSDSTQNIPQHARFKVIAYNSKSFKYIKEGGDAYLNTVRLAQNKYASTGAGLQMNNSDIDGANGIFFGDTLNVDGEGFIMPRDDGKFDYFRILNGELILNGAPINKVTTQYQTPNQSIPASTYTKLNAISYTAKKDGQVEVKAQISYSGLNASGTLPRSVFIRIGKNDVTGQIENYGTFTHAMSTSWTIDTVKTIDVKKGDVLTLWAYSEGTTSTISQNWTRAEFKEL